jgi:16S rRNA (guanine527-N7)-methyltransferase
MDSRLKDVKFESYFDAIIEYNKIHMLTGHTEKDDAYERLFLDAIICFEDIDLKRKKLLDVGTGAGLPGVPLKIVEPSLDVTLLETMQRRVDFLNTLKDINIDCNIIHARAEEVAREYEEVFDITTARAVKETKIALELLVRFTKVGGLIVLPKGKNAENELNAAASAIKKLGIKHIQTYKKELPSGIINNVLVFEKVSKTKDIYPRPYAQIAKGRL